jgi:hypothetical protein
VMGRAPSSAPDPLVRHSHCWRSVGGLSATRSCALARPVPSASFGETVAGPLFNGANPHQFVVFFTLDVTPKATA